VAEMRRLSFSGEYGEGVASGVKTSTIRLRRQFRVGERVEVVAGEQLVGVATVKAVDAKRVVELTDEDARRDGFADRRRLLGALEKHYGGLHGETAVYIIRFELRRRISPPHQRQAPGQALSPTTSPPRRSSSKPRGAKP